MDMIKLALLCLQKHISVGRALFAQLEASQPPSDVCLGYFRPINHNSIMSANELPVFGSHAVLRGDTLCKSRFCEENFWGIYVSVVRIYVCT